MLCTGCRRLRASFATYSQGRGVSTGRGQQMVITTCIFRSPEFSRKEIVGPFPLLGVFGLVGSRLLFRRESCLEVPDGEFDLVASVGERLPVGRGAPFAQTHGQDCGLRFCIVLSERREAEGAVRSTRIYSTRGQIRDSEKCEIEGHE